MNEIQIQNFHQIKYYEDSLKSYNITANVYGEKGVRKQMEDEHLLCFSIRSIEPSIPIENDMMVFGIMDGHGGRETAMFVKQNLVNEIIFNLLAEEEILDRNDDNMIDNNEIYNNNEISNNVNSKKIINDKIMKRILTNAFSKMDSRIATERPSSKDGCTAILLIIYQTTFYIANIGDSSAYLHAFYNNKTHAIPLTEIHKPWVIKEKERILKFGGTIENGRVNGALEVTRSFGDITLKKYGILCIPTLRKFNVCTQQHRFVLIACDGFWSCLTAIEAINKAQEFCLKEQRRSSVDADKPYFDIKTVCKQLVEYVIVDKKSQDNVSVLMIYINP